MPHDDDVASDIDLVREGIGAIFQVGQKHAQAGLILNDDDDDDNDDDDDDDDDGEGRNGKFEPLAR